MIEAINHALSSLKDYSPYGLCFALMLLGVGMYALAGETVDIASYVLKLSGACASALGVICFALWHFLRWPPWFKIRSRRRSSQL
jgi:hypothetical protein